MKTHNIAGEYYEKKNAIYWKLALAVIYAGLFTMFCMTLATLFINQAKASIDLKDSITNVRYQNIRHGN